MGNSPGSPLPSPPDGRNYCCLIFRWPDRLVAVYGAAEVHDSIKQSIVDEWKSGIYAEGEYFGGAYRFKLNNCPFMKGTGFEEAVMVKKLTCKILAAMYTRGWLLSVASDLSRYQDLTTWFFKKIAIENPPKAICCVSISSFDKLQLVNAPQRLQEAITESVRIAYPDGGKPDRTEEGVFEVVLENSPWFSDGAVAIAARVLLVEVVKQIERRGFTFYCTANLKGTADSLYFIEDDVAQISPDVNGFANEQPHYFAISLNRHDRLRCLGAPDLVHQTIQDSIGRSWANGIQHVHDYHGAWEVKLAGRPWCASDAEESVACRMLLCRIFTDLLKVGFAVHSAIDVSRTLSDKSVFVMKSCPPGYTVPHACLSLNSTDRIRALNMPVDLESQLHRTIEQRWVKGVYTRLPQFYQNSVEYTLNGMPWESSARGGDGLHSRAMFCAILQLVEAHGFKVICSADVSAKYVSRQHGPDYPLDVHSWFLAYVGGPSQQQQ